MKNNKLHLMLSFIAGVLATLIIGSIIFVTMSIDSFNENIYSISPPVIRYAKDGRTVAKHEQSVGFDISSPLTFTEGMYFGRVDKSEYIVFGVRAISDIIIYPHDEETVIVEYNPRGFGFTQRYVAHKNFEYYLQKIYEQTGNENFNVYPEE